MKDHGRSRIVVLGNGPSLRDFDFRALDAVDTLGMNAAYRHWERIGWYPTHYTCLDDQLIETHAQAIHEMIVSGKVRSAFLIARILDFHPDLAGRDNVFFFQSFNRTRHARLGDPRVPFIESLPFAESDASKVTTGAYAVRYAAHLGYRDIAVMGVDLRYVEIIPEARQVDGIRLVIDSTPKSNPNYFFDDYQRAGDKFNLPNPAMHERNLHVAAFEALAHDVVKYQWPARVWNGNRQSVLHDQAILPFVDPLVFARRRVLGAMVVPTVAQEEAQLLLNMQIWDEPRLAPWAGAAPPDRPDLVFAFSGGEDEALRQRIVGAFGDTRHVQRAFERVDVRFVGLSPEVDYYERDYARKVSGRGHKSGPNEQFFELLPTLADKGEFIFYMEADCAPLRQGWLDAVLKIASGDDCSWVIGSLYRGADSISERFFMHLNGNALYRVGDTAFQQFARDVWRPRLYEIIDNEDRRMAYDCVVSHTFSQADADRRNEAWQMYQQAGHRFRASNFVQNLSGATDRQVEPDEAIRRLVFDETQTFIVHGRHFTQRLHKAWAQFAAASAGGAPFSWAAVLAAPEVVGAALTQIHPRLLMVDSTLIGRGSATGQLKEVFLQGWPKDHVLQVHEVAGQLALHRPGGPTAELAGEAMSELLAACLDFRPDVLYFRPVDSPSLFDFVDGLLAVLPQPLVIHMMDDWPERLRVEAPLRFDQLDRQLRRLLQRAQVRLAIGDAMAQAYHERYGHSFTTLANGVDVEDVPEKPADAFHSPDASHPFVVRYMGGLAVDMTRLSVLQLAQAVSRLAQELSVRLEIFTMDMYLADARAAVEGLVNVSVQGLVPKGEYLARLTSSDALLIAYNFDEASIRYTGLSMANKLPECLATGVPLLAYGPRGVATIDLLVRAGCACVVTEPSVEALAAALRSLVNDPTRRREMGQAGRRFAAAHHRRSDVVKAFRGAIHSARLLFGPRAGLPPLLGTPDSVRHGARFSTVELQAAKIFTTPRLRRLAPGVWRCESLDSSSAPEAVASWLQVFDASGSTSGRRFAGSLVLCSTCEVKVELSLGRHGAGTYEGSLRQFVLPAGQPRELRVDHRFTVAHAKVQLQLKRLDAGTAADWQVSDAVVLETVDSVASQWRDEELRLPVANQVFRDGDAATALRLYLRLYQQHPLAMYAGNARLAAERLGFQPETSVDAMLALLG